MVEARPAPPEPAAQGNLAKTPFPHLLIYAFDRQLSGTIELAPPDDQGGTILVLDGQPHKARSERATVHLGRVLLELGFVTDAQLDASLRVFAEGGKLHGQILLESGIIDAEQLELGLRAQLIRKLQSLVQLPPETTFRYYDGFDALASYGGDEHVGIDPAPIVWTAIREAPPWEQVHATLTKIGAARVRVGPAAETARFAFDKGERATVDMLRNRALRLHELTSAGTLSPRLAQLLVYCLVITRQAELIQDSLSPPPAPPSSPPSSVPSIERNPQSWRPGPQKVGGPPSAPEGPASPNQVARVQLAQREMAKGRPVVEETSEHLPPDDRRTPMPSAIPLPTEAAAEGAPAGAPDVHTKSTVRKMPAISDLEARPTPAAGVSTPKPAATKPAAARAAAWASKAASSSHPPPSPAGTPLSPELAARRKQIVDRAASIDREDYFTRLGVPRDAEHPAVQAAFFGLAKTWHPDRVPYALADVKEQCARVFARMSEAHQTLTDVAKRNRYVSLLHDGTQETEENKAEILRVVEAATCFQKAEVLLKRNDLTQAEALCRQAIAGDDRQADYHALLAWLESMKPEHQSEAATERFIHDLGAALAMNKMCERAHFYRGMLCKRLHRDDAAVRDFRRAFELNPRNIDAQREVRVFDMRKGSAPGGKGKGDDKAGGLFGKLFKK